MPLAVTTTGNFLYQPDGPVLSDYFWGNAKFSCIQGPIGSGTSSCSCHRVWRLACAQEPDYDGVRRTRWIISRSTYKELRDTTIKTWLDWFPESEWGQMIRSEPAYHTLARDHPSGDGTKVHCEVIFIALPDPDQAESVLASYEITGFFVNEGQFFAKEVIDELLSRCSRYPSMKNGPGATWFGGFMDMNAPVEGHWVPYMRGDFPLPPEITEDERIAYEKPEDWVFFVQPPGLIETRVDGKLVYQPNPLAENQKNLRETYMEKIRGKPKSWIDRRVMNKVGLYIEGQPVYPTFSEQQHVSAVEMGPLEGIPVIVGLDFGREPAAAFMQEINGQWRLLHELIGQFESAQLFAPRVRRVLAQQFTNYRVQFYGDPRGADGTQSVETTAYDVFLANGMRVFPATSDNNPEMRRSAMESVLGRRNGFVINPSCLVAKTGFAGGYHFRRTKGVIGQFQSQPSKNRYSHIVESVENALLGGGEGDVLIRPASRYLPRVSPIKRHRIDLRRRA